MEICNINNAYHHFKLLGLNVINYIVWMWLLLSQVVKLREIEIENKIECFENGDWLTASENDLCFTNLYHFKH